MKYLIISTLGPDRPSTVNELMKIIANSDCNIVDSRTQILGQELATTLMLSGSWNAVAKVEASLPLIAEKLELALQMRRTEMRVLTEKLLPYSIYISALDVPGTIFRVTQFFTTEEIHINELYTDAYLAPYTNTPMVTLTMSVSIPAKAFIADLRERFMLFCDDNNLDVIMEPQKS